MFLELWCTLHGDNCQSNSLIIKHSSILDGYLQTSQAWRFYYIFFLAKFVSKKNSVQEIFKENSFGQGTQIILDFVCVKSFFSDLKNKKTKKFWNFLLYNFLNKKQRLEQNTKRSLLRSM